MLFKGEDRVFLYEDLLARELITGKNRSGEGERPSQYLRSERGGVLRVFSQAR